MDHLQPQWRTQGCVGVDKRTKASRLHPLQPWEGEAYCSDAEAVEELLGADFEPVVEGDEKLPPSYHNEEASCDCEGEEVVTLVELGREELSNELE